MFRQFTIAVIAACPFPHSRGTPLRIQRLSEALAAVGHKVHISPMLMANPLLYEHPMSPHWLSGG